MNRLKLLAMATLMALTITACDEGTPPVTDVPPPPTPVGTISGTVTIDGTGATGITATLSSGATTATGAGGTFSFAGVEAGSYTVTISGYPADAAFPSATQAATIASDGQTVQLNFAGEYIRSSSVVGNVVAADPMIMGSDSNGDEWPDMLDGITVTLEGEHTMAEPQRTMEGGFAFTGLRAGSYTVTISGYPEDVKFDEASMTVEVDVGDVGMANFEGAYIRTAAVEGRVIIEGEGLAGVTVTLTGGPGNDNYTKLTGANGEYAFTELRPGDYQVSISGYDADDYEFASSAHDVSVELDETETVSFTGVLLRTSGISGRVSVEGMGIADIAVTLSGAADDTTMTDASGQYAFAGLAAGDYTVSIAVASAAYVFGSMSYDRTVGDDDAQIVNFEGAHDTSASLSVMLFIDEASKNDTYDEGEDAFPSAAMLQALQAAGVTLPPMLPVPVTLVGPEVNQMTSGALDLATGQILFSGLRAGTYQLRVGSLSASLAGLPAVAVAVLQDYEYGGLAGGYEIDIGVGVPATQAIPVDITHTTAHFTVTLKSGDERGLMPVPGATVTLYSGETEVGSDETGENGEAAVIRFARAGTGGMVNAGVAVDGYHVAEGMTAVSWDSKNPHTLATNSNDIVNLNASFSFKGAALGGAALAGWAISVTSGDAAVAGAPVVLGADGSATFSEAVGAGDLPKTYTIAVDTVQEGKDSEGKRLDGGENYTAVSLEHVHNGLSLAGGAAADDAGTLEVTYTTQTLNVYVHEENDQVMGYTGNILGEDVRMSGMLDVALRYVQNGYRHQFAATDSIKSSNAAGVYTFSNVPADKNVIVTADLVSDTLDIMVLNPDEVAASGFGSQGGGSHHTVELCSMAPVEGQQRHDECATFAFVHLYAVDGQAWKNVVTKSGDDFQKDIAGDEDVTTQGEPGLKVSLDPVAGENIAGESDFFLAEKAADKKFDFEQMAAGVYSLTLSDSVNWGAKRGPADDPSDDLKTRLSPLDSALNVDVTPKTGYVFGTVTDGQGLRAAGVAVDVNGATAVTDEQGRYIVEGFGSKDYTPPNAPRASKKRSVVQAFDPGTGGMKVMSHIAFAANTPKRVNFSVAQATDIAEVNGRVTHSGTLAPIPGVKIQVDYQDGQGRVHPTNATYHAVPDPAKPGKTKDVLMLLTGADGSYTARISATGGTVKVSAEKEFMFFTPDEHTVSAVVGANVSGLNFSAFDNGTISGRVVASGTSAGVSGVIVKATKVGATDPAHADTTGATGTYVLRVPYGSYTVKAERAGYTFTMISNVPVPNDGRPIADIVGSAATNNADLSGLDLSGVKFTDAAGAAVKFSAALTAYTGTVGNAAAMTTVTATPAVHGATVEIDGTAGNSRQVGLPDATNVIEVKVTAVDAATTKTYTVTVTRRLPSTFIEGTVTDAADKPLKGVEIQVGGEAPLNAAAASGKLVTGTDGTYRAEVEGTGATVAVTAIATGKTFLPASKMVTLTPNATVTGVDFVGSSNAIITGRVVLNGAGLSGVTVKATAGSVERTAVSRVQGNFTITNVPIGRVTVTAEMAGHSFESLVVVVTGGVANIGDITGTVLPLSTDASLSSLSVNGTALTADVTSGEYTYAVDDHTVRMVTVEAIAAAGGVVSYLNADDQAIADADASESGHQIRLATLSTVVTVRVTATAGNTADYTLTVTLAAPPPSADASLSSLSVNGTALTADATTGKYTYAVDDPAVEMVTVEAMVAVGVMVSYLNASDQAIADENASEPGHQIPLVAGPNVVTVRVTATAGNHEDYTLTVTLAALPAPGIVITGEDGMPLEEVALTEDGEAFYTYMVSLATAPTEDVTVAITGNDGSTALTAEALTAANDVSGAAAYITLSTATRLFTPSNWDTPQDVKITADEDTDTDADDHEVTLTHTASSSDDEYDEVEAEVVVNITDDDVAGATVTLAEISVNITEGDDVVGGTYTVVLSATGDDLEPTSNVTISIASGDDDDAVLLSSGGSIPSATLSLIFTPENFTTAQTVTVTAVDNNVAAAEAGSATLTHTAMGGGFGEAAFVGGTGTDLNEVVVAITDDDVAAVLIDLPGREVREGGSLDYSIQLATQPEGSVSIVVNAGSHNAAFSFNQNDWSTPQTQTITVPEESGDTDTGAETVTIAVTVAGYGDVVAVTGTFTVRDSEAAEVIVSHTALNVAAGESGQYNLSLTKAPDAGETVTINISSDGLTDISSTTVRLDADNWEDGEDVRLTILPRAMPGTITVTQAGTSNASGGVDDVYLATLNVNNVTVTVLPSS